MMESNAMWKWLYLIGVLAAGLLAIVMPGNQVVAWLLILVGILSAIFFLDSDDVVNFGIRFLLFSAVAGGFGAIPAIGGYLSAFFGGVVGFLIPVGLTLLVMYFWKKYFASMM
jgi:hypothetical protein